ncbi:lipase family protein [Dyella silvatica]|uniref:lipase family protein n=1 Tax=Dyella silvatica TaxID=2992128 RepID=UPI00225998ED|nr:lipase family protein [Dyella silvatica]
MAREFIRTLFNQEGNIMESQSTQLQTALTLAYIVNSATTSDAGVVMQNPDASATKINITTRISKSKMTAGKFSVVWGPAIYIPDNSDGYSANVTVALKDDSGDISIVTSGTNPKSQFDISDEDNEITTLQELSGLIKSCPSGVQISQGAWDGVEGILKTRSVLSRTTPLLADFVGSTGRIFNIIGHSLGGALATVLAVYFKDAFPFREFHCHTFAGPTAGNGAFAQYFNENMESRTRRVFNTMDIVPCAWSNDGLSRILNIYEPQLPTPAQVSEFVQYVQSLNLGYAQPEKSVSLKGAVNTKIILSTPDDFMNQAAYQHIAAYVTLLGLQPGDIATPPGS